MRQSLRDKEDALRYLREYLPRPGASVYTFTAHVSRSYNRSIRCFIVFPAHGGYPAQPHDISSLVAHAIGLPFDRNNGGVKTSGDAFGIVYNLGRTLFPSGFGCIGDDPSAPSQRCPSNDHMNGDRDYTPHLSPSDPTRLPDYSDHWHKDGGYALIHRDF